MILLIFLSSTLISRFGLWVLKEAGVERQEAGGRLEGDSDPPLNEDRQI